jgi:hypothetical protein
VAQRDRQSRLGTAATIFWTYCLQVAQWLAVLDGSTGSQEAELSLGAGPPLMAHQGGAGLLGNAFTPTAVMTGQRRGGFVLGG